jgi:hypothetical protein
MRLKSMLGLLVLTASLACKDDGGQGPSDALGALAAAGGQVIDAGADVTAPAVIADDPGPPASFYGSKCTVIMEGEARPGPECISSPIESKGGRTHLFLNFCVANGENRCAGKAPPVYASLVVALPAWQAATITQAERALVRVDLTDGRRYAAGGTASAPLPLELRIVQVPHPTEKNVLAGTLQVTVPRIDAPGPALRLRAQIP